MPSTAPEASCAPAIFGPIDRAARLDLLGVSGRLAHYRAGTFDRADVTAWIRRYPEEIPTVNGEFEWIAQRLVDLE
jgi:hypothetical protein